ncbi:SMI1/KNR4 family protein [Streptomyces sp. O3]
MTLSVTSAWLRIEAWLETHAPETFASLPGPAEPTAIAEAQEALGIPLPDALAESLLRHDGTDYGTLIPSMWMLHDVRGLAREWQQRMQIHPEIDHEWDPEQEYGPWWHPQWIPIAWNGCGDSLVIDQRDCTKRGRIGIAWHDDVSHFEPVAWMESLPALLISVAIGLEERDWVGGDVPRVDNGELEWVDRDEADEEGDPPRYGKFGRLIEEEE